MPTAPMSMAAYQSNFEYAFASVKAVGFCSQQVPFAFLFLRFFADAVFIVAVTLNFFLVFLAQEFGLCLILNGKHTQLVDHHLHFVQTNIFRLVISPLIGGLGLQKQFFRMCAMAEKRGYGD